VQATIDRFGRVNGLVNNAGAGTFSRIDGTTPEAFLDLLNLNVVSVVTSIQAVLPHMRAAGHGRIVNISSGATGWPMAGNAIYPATKTAVNWLSQVGRLELSGDNIQVTLLLPSVADTEFYPAGGLPTGLVAHSPEYVGRVILRALRTGEERIDIPHGPEQPEFPEVG
jgi:short-subunit dehydrogenase